MTDDMLKQWSAENKQRVTEIDELNRLLNRLLNQLLQRIQVRVQISPEGAGHELRS